MENDMKATIKDAKCTSATEKALRVRISEKRSIWVPVSAIHDDSEVFDAKDNNYGKLVIMPWFAEQIGVELD